MRFTQFVVSPVLLLGLVGGASGGIIDLRDLSGNFNQSGWSGGGTRIYAQSVVADAELFSEFRFRPVNNTTSSRDFRALVTGARSDGGTGLGLAPDFNDIRFDSGIQTLGASVGQTEFSYFPNIAVTNGETLFLVFDSLPPPSGGSGQIRATQYNGTEQYLPGEFVYLNAAYTTPLTDASINNVTWAHRGPNNEDLAIYAEFQSVIPEPSSMALLGMGIAGLGGCGWRRKRKTKPGA